MLTSQPDKPDNQTQNINLWNTNSADYRTPDLSPESTAIINF